MARKFNERIGPDIDGIALDMMEVDDANRLTQYMNENRFFGVDFEHVPPYLEAEFSRFLEFRARLLRGGYDGAQTPQASQLKKFGF